MKINIIPESLLWRVFFLIAGLMLLSVLAWFAVFNVYEREPRAEQLSQMLVSVANITRAALVSSRPEARMSMLRELSDREGLHVYPAERDDVIAPLPDRPVLKRAEILARAKLGPLTKVTLELNGESSLFLSFRIDETEDGDYWIALPAERLERAVPAQWFGWAAAVLLLSLAGAWLVVSRVAKPLAILSRAAAEIGRGNFPPPVDIGGPAEIKTLASAFNRMGADLASTDRDRALILAGISHDLRTPLTRLRMGVEMSGVSEADAEAMAADIEEMDITIGQFLDFARADGGEPLCETDLSAMVSELAVQYRRRGANVREEIKPTGIVMVRPKAMRRCIANLVENAIRHAGDSSPIDMAASSEGGDVIVSVSDRGPGIPETEVERMMRPFTQMEEARTGAKGAGLGLAIAERVVRGRGGRLALLPRPGGGLSAVISIPTGVSY